MTIWIVGKTFTEGCDLFVEAYCNKDDAVASYKKLRQLITLETSVHTTELENGGLRGKYSVNLGHGWVVYEIYCVPVEI